MTQPTEGCNIIKNKSGGLEICSGRGTLNDIRWENCHNFISQSRDLRGSVETFPLTWSNSICSQNRPHKTEERYIFMRVIFPITCPIIQKIYIVYMFELCRDLHVKNTSRSMVCCRLHFQILKYLFENKQTQLLFANSGGLLLSLIGKT